MEATMVRLATIAFGLALAAWASPTFAQSDRDRHQQGAGGS
jgi:hypothetical protein